MTFEQFLANLAASILAGLLIIGAAALISRSARWILTGLLGRILRIDVDYVFLDSAEVQDDLMTAIERANDVRILTGRGHELQLDMFARLFQRRPHGDRVSTRVLLPAEEPSAGQFDWTQQREMELAAFDPAFGNGLLKRQIGTTAEFLRGHPEVQTRRFQAPHLGRIILTDRFAYFTPYRSDAHGRRSEVLKLWRGELYDGFARLFELVWQGSEPDTAVRS